MNATPPCSPSPVPLLETALVLAAQLFIARHPDLLRPDDDPRNRPLPTLRAARALVGLVEVLLGELARYQALEADEHPGPHLPIHRVPDSDATTPDNDIPF